MTKNVCDETYKINYNGKVFTSIENSKNGEVNEKPSFIIIKIKK
jgi:hypothetical protein